MAAARAPVVACKYKKATQEMEKKNRERHVYNSRHTPEKNSIRILLAMNDKGLIKKRKAPQVAGKMASCGSRALARAMVVDHRGRHTCGRAAGRAHGRHG